MIFTKTIEQTCTLRDNEDASRCDPQNLLGGEKVGRARSDPNRSDSIRFDPIEFERTCSNSQLDPFVVHDPRAGRLRVRASSADRNVQRATRSIHRLID